MNIVVFEDAGTSQLFPITTGKPAYAISCASFRLIDWLSGFGGNLIGLVRPYLETIQLHDFSVLQNQLNPDHANTWMINARLVPSVSNIQRLHRFKDENLTQQRSVVAQDGWAIASALVPTTRVMGKGFDEIRALIANGAVQADSETRVVESDLKLFEFPHDVVEQNIDCFQENLAHRIGLGNFREQATQVFLGSDVKLGQHVVFDSSGGPIVIDQNVSVGPHSFLRGPVYVGPNSKISEHAAIKDEVSIAHTCKIGGEVEATVIEPYSNKQHHGFLGHSYLGSWINLGAGTCNSDLKNTYGIVNVQYGDRKVSSGMQFLGCVIGDYAKTSINTSIFTGKLIGAGSMVYGFATSNVPSFVNYARTFGEMGLLPPDVVVSTQARMFARRNVPQRPCDIQLIHDMYRSTESERPTQLSDKPIQL